LPIENIGVRKLIFGLCFSISLPLIVFLGGEL
jgi:formate/nitrite transporter FocA (FNT family)